MDIKELKYFCLVAEMMSVTKAAVQIGVSQPFVTKRIKLLEEELGVPLLNSASKRIELTEYGQVFYSQAKKILSDIESMITTIERMKEHGDRRRRILYNFEMPSLSLLEAYTDKYKDSSVVLEYAAIDSAAEELLSGKAAFAICSPPISSRGVGGIETIMVDRLGFYFVFPEGHPLLKKEVIALEDIRGMPFVTSPKGSALRENAETIFKEAGFYPPISFESSDLSAILSAVRQGRGFGTISVNQVFEKPEIAPFIRPAAFGEDGFELGVSYNPAYTNIRDAEAFCQLVREVRQQRLHKTSEI